MSQEIVLSLITAAGACLAAAIRIVYTRSIKRTDAVDDRVTTLTDDLVDCHKLHAETGERIGKLEGWREGYMAHVEKVAAEKKS